MLIVRITFLFVGAFLLLTGLFKAWWEVKAWEVLSKLGERPPLIGNDPRVEVRVFIVAAAVGLTLAIIAMVPTIW